MYTVSVDIVNLGKACITLNGCDEMLLRPVCLCERFFLSEKKLFCLCSLEKHSTVHRYTYIMVLYLQTLLYQKKTFRKCSRNLKFPPKFAETSENAISCNDIAQHQSMSHIFTLSPLAFRLAEIGGQRWIREISCKER